MTDCSAPRSTCRHAADHRRRGRQGVLHRPRRRRRHWSAEAGRKWITSIAAGPQGAIAYATGRSAFVRLPDGKVKEFQHPRSVEGIAFAPKGLRIGVARYNGATLHFPATDGKPTELEWAGAHTGITFSPDGNFLVTTMQENALHGWKLSDGKHMRMSGYPVEGEVAVVERQGQMAGEFRRAGGDRLAVPGQGRADGQGAAGTRHARQRDGHLRGLPSRATTSPRSATRTAWCLPRASPTARKCCCAVPARAR